jgi:hypothetical protein
MTVYEKLIKVQSELKAPKSRKNTFGKYNYRNLEDILEGAKPLLKKYGASLVITDTIENVGERYYVKATATFIDTETGESISNSALARESAEKKGMDDSQITGTSSSYARKYALNGLFLIDDTKDADTDEARIEAEARAKKVEEEKKNETLIEGVGQMKISELKVNILLDDINKGITNEEKLLKYYKVEKLEDITEAQFRDYSKKRDRAEQE